MIIDGREIGESHPPYIIAEISANHNGSLEKAKRLVREAQLAGADAVKLQTYRPDTITLNSSRPEFCLTDGLWKGRTLFDLYEEAHTPWEWHRSLFAEASNVGITMFSTPFDFSAVDFLEELGCPAYKIASFELIDIPLIEYCASKNKPMILSTGMATEGEIDDAVQAALNGGARGVVVLRCVSGYPAPPEDYHLNTLRDLRDKFGVPVGLSDHTLDNTTAICSVAMGGVMIEKHFTLDRSAGGPDDSFSLEPEQLKSLCRDSKTAWSCLGESQYGPTDSEAANQNLRRSIYFKKPLFKGETVTSDHIVSVRPGLGLPPKYFSDLLGRRVKQDILQHTPVSWDLFVDE